MQESASRSSYRNPSRGNLPFRFCARLRALIVGAVAVLSGCQNLNLYTVEEDRQIGLAAYEETLGGAAILRSGSRADMVERVMNRLHQAMDDDLGFNWEVRLVDDASVVNAWALPGGKMAVYTGILPVTQDEDGLAAVMGHEMAHATLRHGTQRMSREVLSQTALGILLDQTGTQDYAQLGELARQVVLTLPYSREQELAADVEGMMYMAHAGYDPRAAPDLWRRMSELGSGGGVEILSTHPSDAQRIENLEAHMPQALAAYEQARGARP